MEWGDIENRSVVIGLHKCKMDGDDILRTLQPLGITNCFVSDTVKSFEDTGGVRKSGDIENRIVIVGLHKCNMERGEIFRTLSPLGITRCFVYRAVKLFEDTGGVRDRQRPGRPRTVRTPSAVKALQALIKRKPLGTQEIFSREMSIAQRSIARIIKEDLGLTKVPR